MRLCVLVMARTNNHAIAPSTKVDVEAGRWRLGEIVDVFDSDVRGMIGADGSPAFHRLYITDWAGTLDEARALFLGPHRRTDTGEIVARSRCVLDGDAVLTQRQRNELSRDRYLTMTTAQAQSALAVRADNVRDAWVSRG